MQHKKELLAHALEMSGIGSLLRMVRPWSGLLVLNYHRIGEAAASPVDSGVFSATQEQFDGQLAWVKRHADVIGLGELDSALTQKRGRFVLITFDDGYLDNFELAFPVLQARSVPATFFITTGFIDDRTVAWWDDISWMVKHAAARRWPARIADRAGQEWDSGQRESVIRTLLKTYKGLPTEEGPAFLNEIAASLGSGRCPREAAPWMSWEMIRTMHAAGHAIGAHTVTHPLLARCPRAQQQFEIGESKRRIEEVLGTTVDSFSYPVGTADAYTAETAELMRDAGIHWAFGFQGGYVAATQAIGADHYALPRMAMEPDLSSPRFHALHTLPQLFSRA